MMMQRGGPVGYILLALFFVLLAFLHSSHSFPFYPSAYANSRHKDYLVEIEDPDQVLDMLAKLGQSIIRAQHEGSNAKRGLDLGLGRGFSGSQAAKHLMGLAAANFAAGPGKKKRGETLMDLGGGGVATYGKQDMTSPVAVDSTEWGSKE